MKRLKLKFPPRCPVLPLFLYDYSEYFVFLKKINLNIQRIKKRVEQGGHNIPTKTVRRRHLRCFENFWNIYRPLSDDWIVLDNSESKPKLIHSAISFRKLKNDEQDRFVHKFIKGHA